MNHDDGLLVNCTVDISIEWCGRYHEMAKIR